MIYKNYRMKLIYNSKDPLKIQHNSSTTRHLLLSLYIDRIYLWLQHTFNSTETQQESNNRLHNHDVWTDVRQVWFVVGASGEGVRRGQQGQTRPDVCSGVLRR